MDTTTINVLISAGVGAGIVVLKEVIFKIIDCCNSKHKFKQQCETQYQEKKEKVYIEAINILSFIRMGFDYTQNDLLKSPALKEQYTNEVLRYNNVAALIKLYATDKIMFAFEELFQYKKFSFAALNSERLFEESKKEFFFKILILSRMMQKDIGIRKLDGADNLELVCPNCKTKHDHIDKCPKCGKTYEEALAIVKEKENSKAKKSD